MHAMRRFRAWVPVLSMCLVALPAAAGDDAAAARRVDRYLAGITTLRADFHQQVRDATGAVRETADGTVDLEKPGRFRWDYRKPSEQLLVSDGHTIWLYDVDLQQVTVRAADQAMSATPAMLLSGEGRVSESFGIKDGGTSDGLEWALLTPRLGDTDFREVRLGFRDGGLVRMELQDRLGQTTQIDFSAVEMNPRLPAGLFEFTPPPDVDVVGSAAGG